MPIINAKGSIALGSSINIMTKPITIVAIHMIMPIAKDKATVFTTPINGPLNKTHKIPVNISRVIIKPSSQG